jgi:hypothetical protein
MGLFLGVSILTFVEVIELLINIVYVYFDQKKEAKL